MEIVSNIALISINETLLVQLISFLILVFIMNRIMFRPLQKVMAERNQYMEGLEKDRIKAEEETDGLTGRLQKKEALARSEALAISKELEDSGSDKASEIFESAMGEIASIKQKTVAEVEAQIDNARKSLHQESETLAIEIMEKVLDRRLN